MDRPVIQRERNVARLRQASSITSDDRSASLRPYQADADGAQRPDRDGPGRVPQRARPVRPGKYAGEAGEEDTERCGVIHACKPVGSSLSIVERAKQSAKLLGTSPAMAVACLLCRLRERDKRDRGCSHQCRSWGEVKAPHRKPTSMAKVSGTRNRIDSRTIGISLEGSQALTTHLSGILDPSYSSEWPVRGRSPLGAGGAWEPIQVRCRSSPSYTGRSRRRGRPTCSRI